MAPSTIAVLNGTSRVNQHLIQQALENGQIVRAIVRSTSRFYAQVKKHDDLSAHVWSDFSDLATLASILDGVDVVYVALSASPTGFLHPSWLNLEAVASICTVLHDRVAPGKRSTTKLILLTAHKTQPGQAREAIAEAVLGHQFDDLRATQVFLRKQMGWLDIVLMAPGMILDSEDSTDTASTAAVQLQVGANPSGAISYARLAAAMHRAALDSQWVGKAVVPLPTTPVPSGLKYMGDFVPTLRAFLVGRVFPAMFRSLVLVLGGGGIGYVVGSRDGGAWVLRTLGINVRS